jgi:RNA polymerase sigma-70 factor (sigma-E family)
VSIDPEFTAFAQSHGDELQRIAYLLCRDGARAEDLVQDALVKLLRRWRSRGAPEHPLAYARRVVINEYLGWRRLRVSRELPMADGPALLAPDDTEVLADRDMLWRLIATLSPRARAVLVCRYYVQLPAREIAELLGCAEVTVRTSAARALAALRANPILSGVREEM